MKKLLIIAFAVMLSTNALALVKCVPDGSGGMCCWDTNTDGPFKPINC
jgi:hypothetical protein